LSQASRLASARREMSKCAYDNQMYTNMSIHFLVFFRMSFRGPVWNPSGLFVFCHVLFRHGCPYAAASLPFFQPLSVLFRSTVMPLAGALACHSPLPPISLHDYSALRSGPRSTATNARPNTQQANHQRLDLPRVRPMASAPSQAACPLSWRCVQGGMWALSAPLHTRRFPCR